MTGWGIMRGCNSLKAICFPDNIKIIGDQFLTGAQALTAVYLPANVEIIKGNKTAGDGPAFGNCPNLYFVNERFDVRDENGNFYTSETFKMPSRPDIYYFPSTLKTITAAHNTNKSFTMDENGMATNTSGEDCAIYNCPSINPILVMPESYQGFDDRVLVNNEATFTEHRGDTISSGLFQKCASKDKPLTVIWLGKINRVSMGRTGEMQYTTYVFANEANTGFENTKIGTWYDTKNTNYKDQNEMYVVFCNANNGAGEKYKIAFAGTEGNSVYPVLTSELQEGATIHMVSPANNALVAEPDCVTDRLINTFCFCGKAIDVNKAEAGTALGHEFDLEKGATRFSIVYANYLANGTLNVKCARCDECDGSDVAPIISSFKGYSTKIDGEGLTFGYTIDYDALDEFVKVNGESVELGFVVAAKAPLGEDAPLTSEGNAATNKVVKASFVNWTLDEEANAALNKYTGADFKLSGNWESIKDAELYMAGYLISDSSIVYLNVGGSSETADYTTYNKVLASESTSEEETPVE